MNLLANINVRKYIDVDNSLKPHPRGVAIGVTSGIGSSDIATLTDSDSIKQSIKNLVMMGSHDKPFHPEIVSGVQQYLFEPATDVVSKLIEKGIESVIRNYEPRVDLLGAVVLPDEDNGRYDVTIVYEIVNSTEPVSTQELGFFMERKR